MDGAEKEKALYLLIQPDRTDHHHLLRSVLGSLGLVFHLLLLAINLGWDSLVTSRLWNSLAGVGVEKHQSSITSVLLELELHQCSAVASSQSCCSRDEDISDINHGTERSGKNPGEENHNIST